MFNNLQFFNVGDVVVIDDVSTLDTDFFSVGDVGHVIKDDGTFYHVEVTRANGKTMVGVLYGSQLKKAINQKLPYGHMNPGFPKDHKDTSSGLNFPMSEDPDWLISKSKPEIKKLTEKEKQRAFFFPDRHSDLSVLQRERIKRGECPHCGDPGTFSHFAYVCKKHGEF
jgi:hypothetical protein